MRKIRYGANNPLKPMGVIEQTKRTVLYSIAYNAYNPLIGLVTQFTINKHAVKQ